LEIFNRGSVCTRMCGWHLSPGGGKIP